MINSKLIKFLLIPFICFILTQIICAQKSKELDSLKNILITAKHDTTKIRIRIEIGEVYRDFRIGYYDSIRIDCEKLINKSQNQVINKEIKKYLATLLNDIGYNYKGKGDILTALIYYNKSLKLREEIKDKKGIANSLNNIGSIYYNQGNIPTAIIYYNKSLKLREEIGDKKMIAVSLNNLGTTYCDQGDISTALVYYNKSLKLREEINDKKGIASLLNNIGIIYYNQGNYSTALVYFNKCLKICETIKDKYSFALSYNSIGKIYYNQAKEAKFHKDFVKRDSLIKKTIEYFNKSLNISEEIGNKANIVINLVNIGEVYFFKNEFFKAKPYATKAHTIAIELGFPNNIKKSAELLYNIYLKEGNYMQALEYYKLGIKMRDSIVNDENFKDIQRQQAKYEFDKKAAIDSIAYCKVMEIKNLEIEKQIVVSKKQKIIIYSFLGGFIIILILLFIIVYQRNKLVKQKQQLENRQIIIDHENTQLKIKNMESENQQLKQQIQPHFLFNSLNTLQALVYENPKIAEEYIKNLSNFLRVSISSTNVNLITIKEELKFCINYLEIQKIRFNNALLYTIIISEKIQESGYVPIFSIQQLLENSIKHNNFSTKKPLNIKIIQEDDKITVINNLQEQLTAKISTGIGLKNISERYRILTGDEIIINKTDIEFIVSIKIIKINN